MKVLSGFDPLPPRVVYCGVYAIKHLATGRMYIGSSGDLHGRQQEHQYGLRRGNHPNAGLQYAYNQDPQLEFVVRFTDNREDAYDLEQQLIDEYFSSGLLFNLASDARFSTKGRFHSTETREKMRLGSVAKGLGIPKSLEHRENIRKGLTGYVKSPEHIEKLRESLTGRQLTPEHRQKVSEANLRRDYSPEHIDHMRELAKDRQKPVVVDGVEYDSIKSAAQANGINKETARGRIASSNPRFSGWAYA